MSLASGQVVALLLVGLLAGALGGLLGIGGSIIMIPGMKWIIPSGGQHLYQAAAMIVNIFVSVPSALRHYKMRAAVPPILRRLIPAAVIGVVGGGAAVELRHFQRRQPDQPGAGIRRLPCLHDRL